MSETKSCVICGLPAKHKLCGNPECSKARRRNKKMVLAREKGVLPNGVPRNILCVVCNTTFVGTHGNEHKCPKCKKERAYRCNQAHKTGQETTKVRDVHITDPGSVRYLIDLGLLSTLTVESVLAAGFSLEEIYIMCQTEKAPYNLKSYLEKQKVAA